MSDRIVIYTDGACVPNPGKGGWAYLNLTTNEYDAGGAAHTTNNRMEMMAICKALASLNERTKVTIKTDSQYSILISKKKTKPTKNPDLWELLHELIKFHDVEFVWVRGHSTDQYNNFVDELARQQVG